MKNMYKIIATVVQWKIYNGNFLTGNSECVSEYDVEAISSENELVYALFSLFEHKKWTRYRAHTQRFFIALSNAIRFAGSYLFSNEWMHGHTHNRNGEMEL